MVQRHSLLLSFLLTSILSTTKTICIASTTLSLPSPTTPPLPILAQQETFNALLPRQGTTANATATTGTTRGGNATTSVSIPGTAAAGGLTFTKPAATDAISYYKIASGQAITFGWNYTSLYVTPASLTFEARCSANSFTYPVGPSTGIPAAQTTLVWDPWAYAQSANAIPFAQASYTLRVWDERGIDAAATAGYFNGQNSLVNFALYSPAAYTPLADGWTCTGCSWANKLPLSHPLLVALPVTAALILIGGAGVLNR